MLLFRVITPENETFEYVYPYSLPTSYIERIERIINSMTYNSRYKKEYEGNIRRDVYRETNVKLQRIEPDTLQMAPTATFHMKEAKKLCDELSVI